MEQTTDRQQPAHKSNWFDRHKVITCFSILALYISGSALFGSFPNSPQQTAVQGVSISIAPATPTTQPTDTPTLFPSDTPTLTPSPMPTATSLPTPITYIAPTKSIIQPLQQTAAPEQGLSNNNYYINSSGNEVHSPANTTDGSVPAGATAKCSDGAYSFSQSHRGTCSSHGGVAEWL